VGLAQLLSGENKIHHHLGEIDSELKLTETSKRKAVNQKVQF
jgi:hypothetical protein